MTGEVTYGMTGYIRHSELDSESHGLCCVVDAVVILGIMKAHAWDSVLSDQRNDGRGDLRNDGYIRHPELDSGSQSLCSIIKEIAY